jgi:phosphate/sulfate permease
MLDATLDIAAELLAWVFTAFAAGALTLLGLLAEGQGLANLTAGHEVVAVWFAYMGAIALYAGAYVLGYRTLLPRIAGRASA